MDESSLLEQPSDIDELEKVKAIESIVLDSGKDYTNTFDDDDDDDNEDHLQLDEDDSELQMLHSTAADSSSVNVTNSMYDESLKSTDVENGSESCCTATKEVELDSMDDERSTNILVSSKTTSTRPRSTSPVQQPQQQTENETPLRPKSPLPQAQNPVKSIVNSTSTTSISTVSTTSATTSSSLWSLQEQQQRFKKRIFTVKVRPKSPTSQKIPIVLRLTPNSPPKVDSEPKIMSPVVNTATITTENDLAQKTSPVREEPTTSNSCTVAASQLPSKSVGHTVNLLNNNRILIKSVKTIPHAATQQQQQETAEDEIDKKSDICSVSESVKYTDIAEMTCDSNTNANNGSTASLDIKKEQLNENSMDGGGDDDNNEDDNDDDDDDGADDDEKDSKKHIISVVNDIDTSDTATIASSADIVIDGKNSQKIKRENEKVQQSLQRSKVLADFISEHKKRNYRPSKSGSIGKSKHWKQKQQQQQQQEQEHNQSDTLITVKIDKMDRCSSPSSCSVRSASESERSSSVATSSNYGSTVAVAASATAGSGAGGKRSTRSQNTDFSAKQKRFLKGIQQITRGTDDETDNQSEPADDDDEDDVDYYAAAKKQSHITERRKSIFIKALITDTKVMRKKESDCK